MIEYKTGNILDERVDAIVNTVNCVGVMGRGIALQFKNAYPENFKAYAAACKREEVRPGQMFVYDTGSILPPRYIVNFPTKRHWRGKSRIGDIDAGLKSLAMTIKQYNIRTIAIPPLGCGLGGLNWGDVRQRIEAALNSLPYISAIVYEPNGAPPPETMRHVTAVPKMTAGRAILVELMARYLSGLLDPIISLLEVHKLMYFMQETGEPLKLKYAKGHYGPYAENLRQVLNRIEGHFISGYRDGSDDPKIALELVPAALDDARSFLENESGTLERFKRVSSLIDGFESSFGMELLATVHWVVKKEGAKEIDEIVDKFHAWSRRKQHAFSERQIRIALKRLSEEGWLSGQME